jgi:hypothetical protein
MRKIERISISAADYGGWNTLRFPASIPHLTRSAEKPAKQPFAREAYAAERAPWDFGSWTGAEPDKTIDLTPLTISNRLRHLSIKASSRSSTANSAINCSSVATSIRDNS